MGEVGENVIKSIFEQLDKNGNGKLDFNEAINAFETLKSIFKNGDKSSNDE